MIVISRLDQLQYNWGKWADSIFGIKAAGSSGHYDHLKEEVDEVQADPTDVLEYADCLAILLDIARINGINASEIVEAYTEKLEINKKREWLPPDERGIIRHK